MRQIRNNFVTLLTNLTFLRRNKGVITMHIHESGTYLKPTIILVKCHLCLLLFYNLNCQFSDVSITL